MIRKIFIITVLLITMLSQSIVAQDLSSFHIGSEEGLTQSNVKSIVQDSYGFIWLGTKNGLNRYDGHQLMQYVVKDDIVKCNNQNVSALYCGKDGTLWVGTDEGLYSYDIRKSVFTRIMLKAQDGTRITGWISNITEDINGRLWVTAGEQGVFSIKNGKLRRYLYNFSKHEMPCYVLSCRDGSVWACGWYKGLFTYNEFKDRFVNITADSEGHSLTNLQINTLAQQGNNIIISVQNGQLLSYDMRSNVLSAIKNVNLSSDIVRNAAVYGDDIWVGTHNGLYVINTKTGFSEHLIHNHNDASNSLISDNIVYSTYQDSEGGVWVGTMFGGADYLKRQSRAFQHMLSDNFGNRMKGYHIRDIIENKGNIIVGTEDNSISVINLASGKISNIDTPTISLALHNSADGIIFSLFKGGINSFGNKSWRYTKTLNELFTVGHFSVYSIYDDDKGNTWLGTDIGALVISAKTGKGKFLPKLRNCWIYDVTADRSGNIWFASMGKGVWKLDPKTGKYKHYMHDDQKKGTLSSNSVSSITIDHAGNVWFSTDRGGICRYNYVSDDFTRFSKEEGLPDDVAYRIVEDNDGYLWFGTNRGLVRFKPQKGDIRVFTTRDGLPSNQFNYKGGILASDGKIYMATINGLLAFSPKLSNHGVVKNIYFTNLLLEGRSVSPGTDHSPLKENILLTNTITLPHDKTNITLELSTLMYSAIRENNYEYMLEPIDKDWRSTGTSSEITYASLAPGTYKLHIRVLSSAESDEYVERVLTIIVKPAWWDSTAARMAYFLIIVISIFVGFEYYKLRQRRKFEEKQEIFAINKEKELYKNKVDFFTEVAHEIRTPLTLINGPLETIKEMHLSDIRLTKNLSVIEQNTHRLLSLASQLLDFQKVGADKVKPVFEEVDINTLLKVTVDRFEPTFAHNGKSLQISHMDKDVVAMVDKEAVTKILSNLLNNALKYGKSKANITLKLEESKFRIIVYSDGEQIPNDKAEHIFEPFFRINNEIAKGQTGIGIGLSLAQSLARLHNGQLYLDTTKNEGNTFVLLVPLNISELHDEKKKELTAAPNHPFAEKASLTSEESKGKTILVVEDEKDILEFMVERLQNYYIVEKAADGTEALRILKNEHVDIIVSDVMMPKMDGFELCQIIKGDIQLSHIPVVFLTAKNDVASKIEGLRAGAEAYVEKPFSFEYLLNQIKSLLTNREKEREAFSKRPFFPIDNIQMSKEDEEIMQKVVNIINENISDEEFNVEKLADLMCMSRSSLLRKIKQLFNMPPLEFIRIIRLKKAAELIQEGNYRVGEICYKVGFGNQSYFAKMFNRQFGVFPKEFELQISNERQKKHSNNLDSDNYNTKH